MEKAVRNMIYLVGIVVAIALFLSVRGCITNGNKADYMFGKWLEDSARMRSIENKLGQTSYITAVTELSASQMKQYAKSDSLLNILTKKYSSLEAIIRTKGGVYVDTLWLWKNTHDTLPCADFEKSDSIKTRYYSLSYLLTKRSMSINNLNFPDTVTTIIGDRKKGFLGMKREYVVEQTHSNKFVQIQQLTPVVQTHNVKWPSWLAIGAGVGITAGYFIFKQ